MLGTAQVLAEVLARRPAYGEVQVTCPICEDLEASAANRLYLLLTKLGPAALAGAPPSWRPCLPHLEALRRLPLERWLGRWVEERTQRCLDDALAAARRYARTREQRHHHEATGSEGEDLLDAIAMLTGGPGSDVAAGPLDVVSLLLPGQSRLWQTTANASTNVNHGGTSQSPRTCGWRVHGFGRSVGSARRSGAGGRSRSTSSRTDE